MGNNCAINSFTMIAGRNKPIAIGNHVRIGSHVCIVAGNHKFDDPNTLIVEQSIVDLGITIEDDVWLGSSSVVVDGVRIGRGSVIGAGSVVTKDIPPFSIAVGNPARVIRKRGEQKKET
jgi:acetyltransferase-like isoleucine patch superfamily enzyme